MSEKNLTINISSAIEEAVIDTCNEYLCQSIKDLSDIDDVCYGLLSVYVDKHHADSVLVSFAIQTGLTRINLQNDGASVDITPFDMTVEVSDIHNNPHVIDHIQDTLIGFISALQNSYEYKLVREITELFYVSKLISSSHITVKGYKNNRIRDLSIYAYIDFCNGTIRFGMTSPYKSDIVAFMVSDTDSVIKRLKSLVDGYMKSPISKLIENGDIVYHAENLSIHTDAMDRVSMHLSDNGNNMHIAKPRVNMSPNILLLSSLISDEISIIDALYAMKDKIDDLIFEVSYTK